MEDFDKTIAPQRNTDTDNFSDMEKTMAPQQRPPEMPQRTVMLNDELCLQLIGISPGTFMMGSFDGENNEKPIHLVTLTQAYYLGKYEVTQEQWEAVMGNNPSRFKGGNCPVEKVSWNDAIEFCEKLNRSGKAPEGWMFTLPTEAQWEFAARGGNKSKGYKYSGSNNLDEVAWYCDNSDKQTHDVGRKFPNELGLHDMSGNVWEWCLDLDGDYSEIALHDPTGANKGSNRVIRGGSWCYYASNCRVASRNSSSPDDRDDFIGFRLALVPAQKR